MDSSIIAFLKKAGIVPVIKINRAETAPELARTLLRAGIPCGEVTFRTEAAAEAIRRIREEVPDFFVAAGTVLTPETAEAAAEAGAGLIVAPCLNRKVADYCLERRIPYVPGVATPTEIDAAREMGLSFVKFFPAENCGGAGFLKSVGGPFPDMQFMPTGGINGENLKTYLTLKNVVCCGGSWMVPTKAIDSGDQEEIFRLAKEAADLVAEVRK